MKENWTKLKDLLGIDGFPKTIQGITYKAKAEKWERRRILGVKGRAYEYNVPIMIKDKITTQSPSNQHPVSDNLNIVTLKFDSSSHVLVPELNVHVAAGNGAYPVNEEQIGQFVFSKYWLAKEGLSNANLYLFHVVGDSMESTINDGDIILADVKNEGWTGALNGVFIILVDNMLMVKRIQYDMMNKGFHIKSDNNLYEPYFVKFDEGLTFKVIAKVERILTKMRHLKTL